METTDNAEQKDEVNVLSQRANKAALRVSMQRKKQKNLGERIEKIAYSAFDRLSENCHSGLDPESKTSVNTYNYRF